MATDMGSVAQTVGAVIAKHPALTRFDWSGMSNTFNGYLFEFICCSGFHLSANAVSFVAQALIKHNTLTYLDLSDNPIGDEGMNKIIISDNLYFR